MKRSSHRASHIIHNPPQELIHKVELADDENNREPNGLIGTISPAEIMLGLAIAFFIGFVFALGGL